MSVSCKLFRGALEKEFNDAMRRANNERRLKGSNTGPKHKHISLKPAAVRFHPSDNASA
jgi:hypothetical protein